jgi:hypothetical protein
MNGRFASLNLQRSRGAQLTFLGGTIMQLNIERAFDAHAGTKVKTMIRVALSIAAAAAILYLDSPSSRAGTFGDAPWCAVTDSGVGNMEWDCEYGTVEACAPNVIAGNRGFCNRNPYWVGGPPPRFAPYTHVRHHPRRHVRHD